MVAYLALVLGPLRNHRYIALTICAMFAVLDETLQASTPGRTGSIYDVAVDVAGALRGFFLYSVIAGGGRRAAGRLKRPT
jgi:VanZ family protein